MSVLSWAEEIRMNNVKYAPFQQRTISHVLDVFVNTSVSRMLCSDEVGLGKTFVARGVIRGMAWKRLNEGHDRLDVLYLCSNLNIAKQNKRKLGIERKNQESDSRHDAVENRSSMLYLQILEDSEEKITAEALAKEYAAATGEKISVYEKIANKEMTIAVLPVTPDTSIDIKGMGNEIEREYIIRMLDLCEIPEFKEISDTVNIIYYEYWVKKLICTGNISYCRSIYKEKFDYIKKSGKKAEQIQKFRDKLLKELPEGLIKDICSKEDNEEKKKSWEKLRQIFASVTLELISYDLVIVDEFQNFTKIITAANENAKRKENLYQQCYAKDMMGNSVTLSGDTEAELLDRIFSEEVDGHSKILMLSATPFRLYMGTEKEIDEANGEKEQTEESIDTICDFLQRGGTLKKYLKEYKNRVKQYAAGNEVSLPETLMDSKKKFEIEMKKYFTRLERNALLRELRGFSDIQFRSSEEKINTDIDHLIPYVDQLADLLQQRSAAVRYGIQIPFAISFMPGSGDSQERDGYRVKKDFLNNIKSGKYNFQINEELKYSVLSEKSLLTYAEPLGMFHGVYRDMLYQVLHVEDTEENINEPGAGRLLWIPPLPAGKIDGYELKGAFQKHQGYGKTIVFSSWRLVPRGIAVLFSYEVRRRLLCAVFPGWESRPFQEREDTINRINRLLPEIIENIRIELKQDDDFWTLEKVNLWKKLLSADIVSILAVWAECCKDTKEPWNAGIPQQILWLKEYSRDGCLDLTLEEYAYMNEGYREEEPVWDFVKSSRLAVSVTTGAENECVTVSDSPFQFRTFFARGLGSSKDDDKINAIKNLQTAFNSPFAPFVFATTSIGQEGLDFHAYADRIIHWNLPSNPVDFEQREGRINRRNCFAIRKAALEHYYETDVQAKTVRELYDSVFDNALKQCCNKEENSTHITYQNCGMIPHWILPYKDEENYIKVAEIERIVPYFQNSEVLIKYHNNLKILQLYRSVIGQPDPEELMERLVGKKNGNEVVEKLFMDFSPLDSSNVYN